MDRATSRFAHRLDRLGLRRGDRLVVQVEKAPETVFLYLACLRAGVIYVPLNTAYVPSEVAHFVKDCAPTALVCRPADLPVMLALATRQGISHVLTLDRLGGGPCGDGAEPPDAEYPDVEVAPGDVAAVVYTSGTTGRPKGAMMTHGHLWDKADTLAQVWGWECDDVLLHAMPIFHTHGLFLSMHCALASGAGVFFLSRFDADGVIGHFPRVTVFTGVPTMYTRLLARPLLDTTVCRNMRLFIAASAPLSPETFRAFRERTGHAIVECWGMTETLTNASNPLHGERRPGTVGQPVPGVELRVADNAGRPLPRGSVGGLEVRTRRMFAGYWNAPEETRVAFRADGFFVTGDLGRVGEDGVVAIVGRAKDLIITGGYNVNPKEVETVIDRVLGVEESAVIGVPHPDFGEGVIAVVVRQGRQSHLSEADIIRSLTRELAGFKIPKRVVFEDVLPRNEIGKIEKVVLRARYRDVFSSPAKEEECRKSK